MACVLVSLVSGIPVRRDVAMTGEITLRGRVLPVGGLKEKLLAAVRAGMHTAIVPATNMAELSQIPSHLRQRIKIHLVHTVDEALVIALTRPLAHARSAAVAPRGPAARVVTPPRRGGAA
jgi:ATP-dependent Lon protease